MLLKIKKMPKYITDDIAISPDDSGDPDRQDSDQENSDKENSDEGGFEQEK